MSKIAQTVGGLLKRVEETKAQLAYWSGALQQMEDLEKAGMDLVDTKEPSKETPKEKEK